MKEVTQRRYLRPSQVAAILQISIPTLKRRVRDGGYLPKPLYVGGLMRFDEREFTEWLNTKGTVREGAIVSSQSGQAGQEGNEPR